MAEGLDIIDLDQLAARQLAEADMLATLNRRFSGYLDPETGERYAGIRLEYEEALDAAVDGIATSYEAQGKRPPAEDIRAARARATVKRLQPDLYDEFHALAATIRRLERWLQDARNAAITRQSVLKTERELSGHPAAYRPPPEQTR